MIKAKEIAHDLATMAVPLWLAVAVVLAVAALAIVDDELEDNQQPAKAIATVTATPEPTPVTPALEFVDLEPDDITLTPKILEKSCFGDVSCHITFRVEYEHTGPGQPDPAETYEVTYRVKGGEDVHIGTLTVTGTAFVAPEQEYVATKNAKTELEVVVTDITRR